MRTQVEKLTLKHVFERFLEGAGPTRILYGSDSTNFPRGYRVNVLEEQLAILEELDLTDEERRLILGGNLQRLIAKNRSQLEDKPKNASEAGSGVTPFN
jgi:predicted TIM-barrel fold metal-dependent hydrolase